MKTVTIETGKRNDSPVGKKTRESIFLFFDEDMKEKEQGNENV